MRNTRAFGVVGTLFVVLFGLLIWPFEQMTGLGAPATRPAGEWPIHLIYDVDFIESEPVGEIVLARAEFDLSAASWRSWRQVRTCCGDLEGQVLELRPDGTVWEGGVLGGDVTQIGTQEPGEGLVPVADFAERFPASRDELAIVPDVEITGDVAARIDLRGGLAALDEVGRSLKLDPSQLIAYETVGDQRMRRVVLVPLNLVLLSEEWNEDGLLIHRMSVTSIEFDASAPFASPTSGVD